MKRDKHQRTTVTIQLTEEEYEVLGRVCALKKTTGCSDDYGRGVTTHRGRFPSPG
jgi:hypothetical protein